MIDALNNAVAITLQAAVQQLGFMKEEHGELVKRVLASKNGPAKVSLGCWLDECREKKSWAPLDRAVTEMSEVR